MRTLNDNGSVCISKTWESACGTVTVKTCMEMESFSDFVARHNGAVSAMMKLCPLVQ